MIMDSSLSFDTAMAHHTEIAVFACGCFWCLEAQFQHLDGVISIEAGYTGGHVPNPSYEEVCSGETGHAEACRIVFSPQKISFQELLAAFFRAHDPTQLNRQGNDIGTQYRSALFFQNESQQLAIELLINQLTQHHVYDNPIVTEVNPAGTFYPAENYHNNYFNLHPGNPYCQVVIQPKVRHFLSYLKEKDGFSGSVTPSGIA